MQDNLQECSAWPEDEIVRLSAIVNKPRRGDKPGRRGLIDISRPTWYRRQADDPLWPRPIRLGPNTTAYRLSDVRKLIDRLQDKGPGERDGS